MSNKILFEKYGDSSLQELCGLLYTSASEGNLEEVKYLLTSPDLKYRPPIHFANDSALVVSSSNGHIPIVKYLLNFSSYGEQVITNYALTKACLNNQIETVQFLLDSDTIPHKANIHAKQDYIFRELLLAKNKDILSYLIFDREISRTHHINEYLTRENYNLNDFALEIKTWFDSRELKRALNTEMQSNKIDGKKIKL
jgi:hypothetical protein